jgi:hypothetical protein
VRDNMGLFHVITSAEGLISISFTASRNLLSDPVFYRQCLRGAIDSLRDSALQMLQ